MLGLGVLIDSTNERLWFSFELWGLEVKGLSIFTPQGEGYQSSSEEPWKAVGNSWWS